jgi:predicted O-methyltransferase YrrM
VEGEEPKMIRERLLAAYRRHGYEIRAGQMATEWMKDRGSFSQEMVLHECASAWKDGRRLDTGWGLSWQELSVLEFLASIWTPRAIFGIGNGFGWSTVAMRLLFGKAALVSLDDASEGNEGVKGAELTQDILNDLEGGVVIFGRSPDRVPSILRALPPLNLVLIDGGHSDEQQAADFAAVRPFLASEHIVLFHDVVLLKMQASFERIAADYPGRSAILRRTTTGMGMVWNGDAGARVAAVFGGYAP